jgi:signal transduction histidine kinase
MEHPLSRSASWLRAVLEASLNGVLACEPRNGTGSAEGEPADFQVTYANRAASTFTGIPVEQLLRNTLGNLFPGAIPFFPRFQAVLTTGEPVSLQFDYAAPRSGRAWLEASVALGEGALVEGALVVSFVDVTAARQVQAQAEKTVSRLHSVLDGSPAAIGLLETLRDEGGKVVDFTVVSLNEQFCTLMKYAPAEVIGRRFRRLFRRSLATRLFAQFVRVVETGVPFRDELRFEKGPLQGWFDLTAVRQGDGLAVTVLDVTDFREAELQAQATADLLGGVLDASPWAIMYLAPERDAQGTVVDFVFQLANAQAETVGQRPIDQLVGGRMLEMYPRTRDLGLFDAYVRVLETGKPFEREVFYDGEGIATWSHLVAVRQGDGLVLTNSDVTARKTAELQNQESLQLLQNLLENSPVAIAWLEAVRDPEDAGRIVDFAYTLFNAQAVPVGSTSPPQLWGRRYRALFPAGDPTGLFERFARVVETGQPEQTDAHFGTDPGTGWFTVLIGKHADGVVVQALDITGRKRAEAETLRLKDELAQRATDKYLTLFNSIDQGFCVLEVLFDENAQPVDYRFSDLNPAFETQTGLTNVRGRTLREIQPDFDPAWVEQYGHVARTGEPFRTEAFVPTLGHWFEVNAFRTGSPEDHHVAVLFNNITERKRTEAALRESEQRQAYLLKLGDALRPLDDAVAIQEAVTRTALEHFGADRCYYCEIEGDEAIIRWDAARDDLPSVAGVYPLGSFSILKAVIEAGRPFVVPDVRTSDLVDEDLRRLCLRLQVVSYVDVPVVKADRTVGVLCLVQSTPRNWTHLDVALAVETAERTWAAVERARAEAALRHREATHRADLERQVADRTADLRKNLTLLHQTEAVAQMGSWEYLPATGSAPGEFRWSEGMYRLFGLEPGAPVRPETYLSFAVEADQPAARRIVYFLTHPNGADLEEQVRLRTADGEKTVRIKATVQRNAAGEPERVLGVDIDITDQVRADAALRERGRFIETLTETSTYSIIAVDTNLRCLVLNPQSARELHVTRDDVLGQVLPDAVPYLREQPRLWDAMQRALGGETVRVDVVEGLDPGHFYEHHYTPLRDETGGVYAVLHVDHEITGRIQLEERLRQSAERLQTVLDTSPASIVLLHAIRGNRGQIVDFDVETANHASARLLNVVPEQLPERLSNFSAEFPLKHLMARLVEVVYSHAPQRFEWYHLGLDRWLDVSLARQDDGVVVTVLDVTSLKRLQFSYKHQAETLQGILDNTANAIGLYDALRDDEGRIYDFKVRLFNQAALRMASLRWEDVEGKTLLQISPRSKEIGIFHEAVEVVQTGEARQVTRDFPDLNKSLSIVLSRLGSDGLIVASVDITALRQAQRQQEELVGELRRSNINLEQFAYVTSHDLQEPLRKIQSFGQMLRKRLQNRLDDPETDLLNRMQDAAGRMKSLIEDLLTFSRLTAKKESFRLLNLNHLAREVLSDLEPVVAEKGANVEVEALPRLRGDAMQWRQLLQNLLSNALKFSKPGVVPHVRITARTLTGRDLTEEGPAFDPDRPYHAISVTDNGIGFDETYRERIFDMFQRLHGRAEYAGTGIGLAIARKVAEQHGGFITAHGREGEGATFTVYVPAQVTGEETQPA